MKQCSTAFHMGILVKIICLFIHTYIYMWVCLKIRGHQNPLGFLVYQMKHFCGIFWEFGGCRILRNMRVRSLPLRFQRRGTAAKTTRHISQAHGQDRHVDLQFAHRHSGQISYILAEHTISLDLIAPSWANRRQNERESDHTT